MNHPSFLKTLGFALTSAVAFLAAAVAEKPNIVLIITDDMGFSDLGCYGGEINTPNIDSLAEGGLKFSQFYNCGKCEPSRAALVTGQQWWTASSDLKVRTDSPNFAEVIGPAGYRTMMVGKWHCAGIPFERGFDRHFGFMGGGTNFFLGDDSFLLDGKKWEVPKDDFYVTTALSDFAVKFIKEEKIAHPDKPFFLYPRIRSWRSGWVAQAAQVTADEEACAGSKSNHGGGLPMLRFNCGAVWLSQSSSRW